MLNSSSNFTINEGQFQSAGRDININPSFIISNSTELEEIRKYAEWLTSVNFRNIQSDTFMKHTSGTGGWFLKSLEFKRWQSDQGPRVLWITGMPGGGKTVLLSIVINHLDAQRSSQPDILVLYAYCRYNDRYSVTDILLSFVRQLLEGYGFLGPRIKAFCSDYMRKDTRPSKRDLIQLLSDIFASFSKIFTFIDALDEIPDDVKQEVLEAISLLSTSLLLTSRPLESFKYLLPEAEFISMEAATNDDIACFITTKINETPRLYRNILKGDPVLISEVKDKLKEKSQGMFLVAALHIESLKTTTTLKNLRKALDLLPSGVEERYRSTWNRILSQPEEESALAKRAITWLTYVSRSLTIDELIHALAISPETNSFDEDDMVDQDLLVSVCCGLITVDEQSRIARLVHYTAHDFFRSLKSDLTVNPHSFIASNCIAYLTTFNFPHAIDSTGVISRREELTAFIASQPLLDYAYHHWGHHAHACLEGSGLPPYVEEFLGSWTQYPSIYQDEVANSFDILRPVHVMASYGLSNFLPTIIQQRDQRTERLKRSSFHLAALYGQADIIRALLENPDTDVNAEDKGKFTALMLASRQAQEEVVRMLLQRKGVNVNKQDHRGYSALIRACQVGHRSIVELLLAQKGVEVSNTTGSGRTPLGEAAFCGEKAIVELLLAHPGINVNQRHRDQTPLMRACIKGDTPIVKILIAQPSVVVNKKDAHGLTALHYAVKHNHEGVVRCLLTRRDLNVNKQNNFGNTALTLAASAGSAKILELLLSKSDIDVNKPEPKRRDTALHLAARQGYIECVTILAKSQGININARNSGGYTPLNVATGHDAVVQFLSTLEGIDTSVPPSGPPPPLSPPPLSPPLSSPPFLSPPLSSPPVGP